jgi:hypothetical protein
VAKYSQIGKRAEAVALVEQFSVVSSKLRTTGGQRNHANPQVTDTKEYWRITLYYQFVDHLLKDLRDHLVNESMFDIHSQPLSNRRR